ncbi:AAA family ATPase, partial [Trabulsiella guamensis]|uniref:AAA family ATPase n=1 Tax=Trabulsiella guamensis TaxID=158852 RepID=UPI001FDEF862
TMTQINHDAIRSAVRELTDNKVISGAALAREIGTSNATVSQFLSGKYKGDNDTIAASLSVWLENRNTARTTLPVAPDFVETPTAQKIVTTLTWAQLAGTIVLVYGNPGVGKTKAIRHYADCGNNVWHITASKSRSNELETLYELALKMGISNAPYRRGALSRLLRERLPGTRGLIVVDEADWLSLDAVEELRILQEECGVGLALVGNHKVYDRLTGGQRSVDFARLFSRVSKKFVINTVSAGDVESFCDAWHVTGDDERKLLKAIARRPGALRSLSHILPLAGIYAQGKGEAIGTAHIQSAMLELGHSGIT